MVKKKYKNARVGVYERVAIYADASVSLISKKPQKVSKHMQRCFTISLKIIMFSNSHQIQKFLLDINALKPLIYLLFNSTCFLFLKYKCNQN